MTYCVGLRLDRGLVMMSDTRTNSGVDNVSSYSKMFSWAVPGDRTITLLSAGNLATTQAVVSLLDERTVVPADRSPSILEAPTMFQVARLVGDTVKEVIASHESSGQEASSTFHATFLLSGQIGQMEPRLYLVYPEGNFIESSSDTQFLQIGETKYGRPILVRAYDPSMTFEQAVTLLLVSFDSTMKANLSVGLPLDLHIYETNSLTAGTRLRITEDDPHLARIRDGWGAALRTAVESLPSFEFPVEQG